MNHEDLNKQILGLAHNWENVEASQEKLNEIRRAVAEGIVRLVKKHGAAPPRATRLRVLKAEDGTELRVTIGQELRVDGSIALRLREVLREAGCGRIFRKLFRRVDSYVIEEAATQRISFISSVRRAYGLGDSARRAVVKFFTSAIVAEDKSPSIEVKRPVAPASGRPSVASRKESAA